MEPASIYLLSVFVLLFILILLFRKLIKMSLIRLKHGKYSYNYVKQFKKYANKSPFPYCFKDDIMPYLRLSVSKKNNVRQYQSSSNLLFESIPYHATLKEILNNYGDPDCFNAFHIKNKELRAYGYNKSLFGVQVKAIFFFIFETFVMGEYLIEDLSEVDIRSVSKSLMDHCGVVNMDDDLHYYIKGMNETSVYFYENGFSALIRYSEQENLKINELIK